MGWIEEGFKKAALGILVATVFPTIIAVDASATTAPVIRTVAGIYESSLDDPSSSRSLDPMTASVFIVNRGSSPDGLLAREARLDTPTGVAFTKTGQVLIADYGNGVVRKVKSGRIYSLTQPDERFQPVGVATMADGGYLIVNRYNTVNKLTMDGNLNVLVGHGLVDYRAPGNWRKASSSSALGIKLNGPEGISPTDDGGLLVADTNSHVVRKIAADGKITTVAGTGGFGPVDVNRCYETNTHGTKALGDGGKATEAILNHPSDVAALPNNEFLIAERNNHRIRKVDAAGVISTVAGSGPCGYFAGEFWGDGGPATKARLNRPYSIAVLPDGKSFVIADTANNRIRMVGPTGEIATIAGTGVRGFSGDGVIASKAQMAEPRSLDVDREGRILVADTDNHLVRMIAREEIR